MPQNNRVFAWRRDEHDPRDHVFGATAVQPLFAPAPVVLPPIVDLEPKFQPVYDQLNLGSCVYNACGGLYEYLLRIEGKTSYTPSRLFGYWNGRNMDGTVNQDSGSTLRTGMKVLAQIGAPDETLWPYNPSQYRTQPPQSVFAAATPHKATAYQTAQPDALAHANVSVHGLPVRVRDRLLPRAAVGPGGPDRHRPDAPARRAVGRRPCPAHGRLQHQHQSLQVPQ